MFFAHHAVGRRDDRAAWRWAVRLTRQFLLAALGVGISGGSFSVGIAYVVEMVPEGKQGTALGIFGAGNVGAAFTKLAAPTVMVAVRLASGRTVWAAALA